MDFLGQDDLLCLAMETLSHLHDTQLQQFLVCLVQSLLVLKGETLVDGTIGDVDIVDVSDLLVISDGKDIDIVDGVTDHLAFRHKLVDEQVASLHLFCLLKTELVGEL